MNGEDALFVIAALADVPFVTPGSKFDRECQYCHRSVALAPTSQRMLKTHADVIICCVPCYEAAYAQRPQLFDQAEKILAGTPEEVQHEISTAVPNLRRNRN